MTAPQSPPTSGDLLWVRDDPRTTRYALLTELGRVGIHPPEGEGEPWIVTAADPQPCSEGDSLADAIRETAKLLLAPSAPEPSEGEDESRSVVEGILIQHASDMLPIGAAIDAIFAALRAEREAGTKMREALRAAHDTLTAARLAFPNGDARIGEVASVAAQCAAALATPGGTEP